MKLDLAIFYSNDLSKIIPFYRDVVGLEVEYIQEGRFASFRLAGSKHISAESNACGESVYGMVWSYIKHTIIN